MATPCVLQSLERNAVYTHFRSCFYGKFQVGDCRLFTFVLVSFRVYAVVFPFGAESVCLILLVLLFNKTVILISWSARTSIELHHQTGEQF
jgi:hypothetical protein